MGAMGQQSPSISLLNPASWLNPKSWLPQTGAEPTGDNNGTPEGDKALANGMIPVPEVGIYPGMAGLKSLGDGFARAQAIQYNRGITERILGNQQGRLNADSAAFGTYMTPASRANQAAAPSPDAAPTARANLGMASPPPPAFPVNAARPDATPSVAGGNGPLGGVGLSVPQAPDQAFRAPEMQTQDDVDFNVNPVTTTGPRGMAGPLPAATDPITAPETPVKSYVGDGAKMPLGAGGSTPTPPIQRDAIPTAGSGNVRTPDSAASWFNKPASPQPQQAPQQAAPSPRQAPAAPQTDLRLDMIAAEKERLQPMFRNPGTRAFALQRLQDLEQREYQINDPANQEKIALQRAQLEKTQLDIATAKNTPGVIGTDNLGNPIHGFIDPINKTATPFQFNGSGSVQGGDPSLTGDAYLKTLDPALADEIKGYAEGRIPYSQAMNMKPRGQALTNMIMRYDPNFDAINYSNRNATRKAFTSGKAADNIRSLNTAVSHLAGFDEASTNLNNSSILPGVTNNLTNLVQGQYDPRVQANLSDFETKRKAATDEVIRAFKGAGATVSELEEMSKNISSASSPAALHAYTHAAIDLLHGRLSALSDQYNQGMGTTKQPFELLNPEAQAAIAKMTGKGDVKSGQSASPNGQAASATVKVINGQRYHKVNGQWMHE